MRIGIITFHFVPNQGAVLQCYAMQKFLEDKGHTVQIIDYRPAYHTVRYAGVKNPFGYTAWFWKKNQSERMRKRFILCARSFVRCLITNIICIDKRVMDSFNAFTGKYLRLTETYTSFDQLKNHPPAMDAYISGSDQLWNPELLDQKFDEAYFLAFGKKDAIRISYAVSMGKVQNEEYMHELKRLCSQLTAVSLREYIQSAVEATGRNVHICIDPTLLLDASDYSQVESRYRETEPYIFIYGFETTEGMENAVCTAIQKYRCKVINGSPHRVKLKLSCVSRREYGPDMFLSYIHNAQCVVTNSFHATAFSIIYRKDFITVPHSTRGIRMRELMGKLNLNVRLWYHSDFDFEKKIDWNSTYQKLKDLRSFSAAYIVSALQGVRGEDISHHSIELKS